MRGKFVTFTGPRAVTMSERDLPSLEATDILMESEASLISAGTERHFLRQAFYYPFYPGYSIAGHVAAVGSAVRDFSVGDHVVASAPHGSHIVCDAAMACHIPPGVTSAQAAFMTVGAMAIHAVRLARIQLGDPVLVIGQGLIGLVAAQIARLSGGAPVIGVDIDAARLDLARSLGADIVVDGRDEGALERICTALPGGGVAASIELSGVGAMVDQAITAARRDGTVVAASIMPGRFETDRFAEVFGKGLSLVGAYFNARPWRVEALEVTLPADWPIRPSHTKRYEGSKVSTSSADNELILQLISLGRVKVDPLISDNAAPDNAPALFGKLDRGELLGGMIAWR